SLSQHDGALLLIFLRASLLLPLGTLCPLAFTNNPSLPTDDNESTTNCSKSRPNDQPSDKRKRLLVLVRKSLPLDTQVSDVDWKSNVLPHLGEIRTPLPLFGTKQNRGNDSNSKVDFVDDKRLAIANIFNRILRQSEHQS
ncbi:hypothetical protein Tcan_10572, partial [Toxocara canis]